jgi:hypothetical protein
MKADELGARLDRVLEGPEAIESQTFFRVVRPLLAVTGWRASLETKSIIQLVAELKSPNRDWRHIAAILEKAEKELESNIGTLERVTIVRKTPPTAHVMWLRRVVGVLGLARAASENDAPPEDVRAATHSDPSVVLPPLSPLRDGSVQAIEESPLVDLELASIDHLMAAARAESLILGRRRRLLLAARQRLLEASAALPLERNGVADRARWLALEITKVDRLEAAGLSPDVSLVHQARQALGRRDANRLYSSLSAIEANSLGRGDRQIARHASAALAKLSEAEGEASADRSARELLGANVEAISAAVANARAEAQNRYDTGDMVERAMALNFLKNLPADADKAITNAAIAADGFFEVGGALAPVRILEEHHIARVVKHPTRDLVLQTAEDVNDLRDAIITDPRSILMDLAIGRLFARRFVRDEPFHKSRIVMHGEVRVYVLDGSGSMKGARARVRDAILVAELSTLMKRLENPRDVRCTLFYRYFDEELGPSHRIETVKEARDAIRDVVGNERQGGTDIQLALVSCLDQIEVSRAADPDLARAQIVLVTDGESEVDEATLVKKRESMSGLPIGVSVIALGQENAALKGLVARQRAKGESAFYHYLDDGDLDAIVNGLLTGDPVHAPESWHDLARDPRALEAELGGLIDELEGIDRARDVEALERIEEEAQARRDLGLEAPEVEAQGELARVEALRRDRSALAARYARWFPPPAEASEPPSELHAPDLDATICVLASVTEVVALLGGSSLARQADAIELLERLLPDARLTPVRYRSVLRDFPAAVAPALQALHDTVVSPSKDPPVRR